MSGNTMIIFGLKHLTTEQNTSFPLLKEYNIDRSTSMQSDWKDKILRCFNYLRDNIDPLYLLNKMYDENFLTKESVTILTKDSRCIKSTQVMIAVVRRIRDEISYNHFKTILSKYHKCCADKLDEQCDGLGPIASYTEINEDYSKHKQMLTAEKTSIEDGLKKLNKEKLLNISGTFVEKRIFDLNGIEEILDCIITKGERGTVGVFTERVIANTEKGSFSCFIQCLKQYKTNNDMMRLYKTFQNQLGQLEAQEGDETRSVKTLEALEKKFYQKAAEKLPCDLSKQHNFQPTKVMTGSIVIYFKSMNREVVYETQVLRKLFMNDSLVQSVTGLFADNEIKALCQGITVVTIKCEMIAKADRTGNTTDILLDIIEANKSFLIEEIDTGTLVAAFQKRKIKCFERHGIDLNTERTKRATQFLQIVRKEDLTTLFMEILEQEEMENISERLKIFKRIFTMDVDSSMLAKGLLSKFHELTELLEIGEIKDVFLERRILLPKIFDDIDEMCWDMPVAAILIEILNSGKNSMLTLVELLYLKGDSCLDIANTLLDSASADTGFEETNTKDKTNESHNTHAGTEFSITLKIADFKDIQQKNTGGIRQEQTTLPITDEHKQTDDASSSDELDSGQYPDEVSFWYVEDLNRSQFVIDRERKVVYCNGDMIYNGPCEVMQHPHSSSDDVKYCYKVQGNMATIYIQSNALNRMNSPNPNESDNTHH